MRTKAEVLRQLTPLGRFMRMVGAVRVYRIGDTAPGFVFRWWHPLSWVAWLIVLQVCGWTGGSSVNDEISFRLDGYYRERLDEVEWL